MRQPSDGLKLIKAVDFHACDRSQVFGISGMSPWSIWTPLNMLMVPTFADFEDCNWCLTDDKCTLVKYGEASAGNWVVHKAVHPPMLMDGNKLELSAFVLVRSFEPLEAYVHKEIVGRRAQKAYTTDAKCLHHTEIHMPFDPLESNVSDNRVYTEKCVISWKWQIMYNQWKHVFLSAIVVR